MVFVVGEVNSIGVEMRDGKGVVGSNKDGVIPQGTGGGGASVLVPSKRMCSERDGFVVASVDRTP